MNSEPQATSEPKATLQFQGSILTLSHAANVGAGSAPSVGAFCVDNTFTISHIDNLKIEKQNQVAKGIEPPHRHSHAFCCDSKARFCIPLPGENKVCILEMKNGKMAQLATLESHDGDIESCAFSPDGEVLATGGQDGRVFFYDCANFLPITSLLARSDYISCIAFSKNSELVALCGFDKFTVVFDMLRHKVVFNFPTNDVVESAAFFENDEKLILVCRNCTSVIFSLNTGKIIANDGLFAFWPTCVAVDSDENYALVGTRSEIMYIVCLADNTKRMEIKNEHSAISSICFSGDFLYIGTADGALLIIDYNEGKDELESALEKKDYKTACEAIERNVFLSIHPLTKKFDEAWPAILEEAIELLNADNIEAAVDLTAPFMASQKRKNEFDFYLNQKDGVKAFLDCVDAGNFQKAYQLMQTSKFLAKTPAAEKLENIWAKAFFNAKKALIEDPKNNLIVAQRALAPFESTPKKELVVQLLRNADVFVKADQLIKAQNFKEYFSLTFKFSFLRDTDLYRKVLILGERMMQNLTDLEIEYKYEEAKKLADTLLVFPNLKRSANEHIVLISQKESLLTAITAHDIKKVYDLVDSVEALRSMPQFKDFTLDFLARYNEALGHARAGECKSVISVLGEYMEINYWIDKIGSLFKIAYLRQIEKALSQPDVNWRVSVKRFVERYGKPIELVRLVGDIEAAKATLEEIEGEGEGDGYRHCKFVDDIIVYVIQKEQ